MRVLIVDDHQVTRLGLKLLLSELAPNLETFEAGNLADAIDIGKRGESVDLVLLDVRLPDGNGVERLQRIKESFDSTPIVVMSAEKDPQLIRNALEAGASGYIPKDTENEVTVNAWRLVLAKGLYLPPDVLPQPATSRPGTSATPHKRPQIAFTDQQLAVLQRLLLGHANKVIARQLGISEGAVKAHLAHIFDKLGVSTRLQAMAKAQELGFFEKFANLTR